MPTVTFTLASLPSSTAKRLRFEPRDAPWVNTSGAVVTPDGFESSYPRGAAQSITLDTGPWRVRIGLSWYPFDVPAAGGDLAELITWSMPAGAPASTIAAAVAEFLTANPNGLLTQAAADANYAPIDDPRFEGLGGGGPVSVTYNPDGSVASVTENGITTTYGYNPDGTIASDLRNGVLRTYAYDGDNLVSIGTGPTAESFTYNPDGSVASHTRTGITTTYTYNTAGAISTETTGGVTKTYSYDGAGNLTGIAIEED